MTDADLIAKLGGPTRLAKRLQFGNGGTQRVSNWLRRGIPPKVKVEHPDVFLAPIGVPEVQPPAAEAEGRSD